VSERPLVMSAAVTESQQVSAGRQRWASALGMWLPFSAHALKKAPSEEGGDAEEAPRVLTTAWGQVPTNAVVTP
jgi:hypothetical protein